MDDIEKLQLKIIPSVTPRRVCEIFKRAFGLKDGIKQLQLSVTADGVRLLVTYFVTDAQCAHLENLEEFELVPKKNH